MSTKIVAIIVVAAVFLLLLIWFVATYNSLVAKRTQCEEAFATMDVFLKKRFDLIPNLVSTVKGYAKHESETLINVIKSRASVSGGDSAEDVINQENQISNSLKSIFALSEAYPDLKANENFVELQKQLMAVEEDISNSRKYYNGCVRIYNTKCQSIPASIVAKSARFKLKSMFEVDAPVERKNVKVEF